MGYWYNPDKTEMKGEVRIIEPKPVWEVKIHRESRPPYTILAGTKKAEEYFKAGHEVKLKTTAGELQQYHTQY